MPMLAGYSGEEVRMLTDHHLPFSIYVAPYKTTYFLREAQALKVALPNQLVANTTNRLAIAREHGLRLNLVYR